MKVYDLMTRGVHACKPDQSMAAAAQAMWEHDCGCVPVVDVDSHVLGMITDRDICMAAYTTGTRIQDLAVSGAMSRDVYSVHPEDSIKVAEETMWANQVRRLPVVDGANRLVGLISLNDIARHLEPPFDDVTSELGPGAIALTMAAVSEPHHADSVAR